MTDRLKGRKALVTGGAGGIGAAIALALALQLQFETHMRDPCCGLMGSSPG